RDVRGRVRERGELPEGVRDLGRDADAGVDPAVEARRGAGRARGGGEGCAKARREPGRGAVGRRATLPRTMRAHATAAANETAILSRLIGPDRDDLPPEAARSLLKLAFDAEDRVRMHELAVKAQGGPLEAAEQAELDSYRRVGRLLELMHSKARM